MIARSIVLWALTVAVLAGSLPIPGDHDSLESTVQRLVQQKLHGAQPHAWRQEDAATRAARIRRAYARLIGVARARRGFRLRHALLAAVAVRCPVRVLKIVINHSNAGFFAYLTFALNQILYAEEHGLFPVVVFGATSGCDQAGGSDGHCGANAYFDAAVGDNMWEYFFEQPGQVSMEEIEQLQQQGANISVGSLGAAELWHLHLHERLGVFTHAYGFFEDADDKTGHHDEVWWREKVVLAHRLIQDYIALRAPVLEAAVHAVADLPRFTVGVHIRGTDKGIWGGARKVNRVVTPREFGRAIDAALIGLNRASNDTHEGFASKADDAVEERGIFVATDQQAFRAWFSRRYVDQGIAVVWRAKHLSSSKSSVFQPTGLAVGGGAGAAAGFGGGYAKGLEVLVDSLVLSQTMLLVKASGSAVAAYASFWNPALPTVDLSYAPYPTRPVPVSRHLSFLSTTRVRAEEVRVREMHERGRQMLRERKVEQGVVALWFGLRRLHAKGVDVEDTETEIDVISTLANYGRGRGDVFGLDGSWYRDRVRTESVWERGPDRSVSRDEGEEMEADLLQDLGAGCQMLGLHACAADLGSASYLLRARPQTVLNVASAFDALGDIEASHAALLHYAADWCSGIPGAGKMGSADGWEEETEGVVACKGPGLVGAYAVWRENQMGCWHDNHAAGLQLASAAMNAELVRCDTPGTRYQARADAATAARVAAAVAAAGRGRGGAHEAVTRFAVCAHDFLASITSMDSVAWRLAPPFPPVAQRSRTEGGVVVGLVTAGFQGGICLDQCWRSHFLGGCGGCCAYQLLVGQGQSEWPVWLDEVVVFSWGLLGGPAACQRGHGAGETWGTGDRVRVSHVPLLARGSAQDTREQAATAINSRGVHLLAVLDAHEWHSPIGHTPTYDVLALLPAPLVLVAGAALAPSFGATLRAVDSMAWPTDLRCEC